jgi:cytochrome c oxidase subunit I
MSTATVEQRLTEIWETPKGLWGWLTTVDHKELGKRYIFTAIVVLLVGGVEALIMRLQLAQPHESLLTPEMYDQIFTMHGMTMIFWYASPILTGFSVFLIPLLIGARDMAYPRLNAFTYWSYLASAILLYVAPCMGQAPHAGWFAYTPYTLSQFSPARGMDFYAFSLIFLTISTTGGAINFITTILRHRAPGMSISKMPLLCYSTGTISVAVLFSLPALTADCVFLYLDRHWGTHFFTLAGGGVELMWQQLFWFFGHPWVYIIFIPALGMISMMVPTFARRPIVGYPYIAIATVLTGVVGFSVWLHHMFAVGMSDMVMSFFSAGSMLVSIFTIIQIFAWVATFWKGKIVLTTSMLYVLGGIVTLVIGGLSGVYTGIIPVDWQVHDTYFVVAHIHYVLMGGNVFPVFAGIYYWFPKMTGKMLNEKAGKWSFWISFIGFNVGFFPMHLLGFAGMPRRIYTYVAATGQGPMNMFVTVGAFVFGIGILISILNFLICMKKGKIAGKNPWNASTLEWDTDSPPAPYATVHIPTVVSRDPLWDDHDESYDPDDIRIYDNGRQTLSTTWIDAEPFAIAQMPSESFAPLLLAITLFVFFIALTFDLMWLALSFFVVSFFVCCYWMWQRPEPEPKPHPKEYAS